MNKFLMIAAAATMLVATPIFADDCVDQPLHWFADVESNSSAYNKTNMMLAFSDIGGHTYDDLTSMAMIDENWMLVIDVQAPPDSFEFGGIDYLNLHGLVAYQLCDDAAGKWTRLTFRPYPDISNMEYPYLTKRTILNLAGLDLVMPVGSTQPTVRFRFKDEAWVEALWVQPKAGNAFGFTDPVLVLPGYDTKIAQLTD